MWTSGVAGIAAAMAAIRSNQPGPGRGTMVGSTDVTPKRASSRAALRRPSGPAGSFS